VSTASTAEKETMAAAQLRGVAKAYGGAPILRDINLDIADGEFVVSLGPGVAIGRSIVRKPKVFLFDEPLSNLDAELRVRKTRSKARSTTCKSTVI
jgi:ABC-type sugar transport system ATPase subunit